MPTYIQGKILLNGLYKKLKEQGLAREFDEYTVLLKQVTEGNLLPTQEPRFRKLKSKYEPILKKAKGVSATELAMGVDTLSNPLGLMKLMEKIEESEQDE